MYLPFTSTSKLCPSLVQCTEGSGIPLGEAHSSKAGSPLATLTSFGSLLNSSLNTVEICFTIKFLSSRANHTNTIQNTQYNLFLELACKVIIGFC